MALLEKSSCVIEKVNSHGIGEATTINGKVFLPFVIEGEEVEFERHKYRGKETFVLNKIVEPSINRAKPECNYYESCGGCMLQHYTKNSYLDYKSKTLQQTLKIDVPIISLKNSKRRRVNLVFKYTSSKLLLGFYRYKSDIIANIDSCIMSEDKISNIIPYVRKLLESISSQGDFGEIFILLADNGIDIKIQLNSKETFNEDYRRKFKSFAGKHEIVRFSYFHNRNELARIIHENPFVTFGTKNVDVEADGFLQATKESDILIPQIILGYIGEDKSKKIADLFCGRGTITIPISENGFNVSAFENDEKSLSSLRKVAKNINIEIRDLYYNPLKTELTKFDIIILNPPRSGAEEQVKNIVNLNCLEKLIYVSCSLDSFQRDYEILKANYEIINIVAIDQFMFNPHIEIIANFQKIMR